MQSGSFLVWLTYASPVASGLITGFEMATRIPEVKTSAKPL
jgi:hypothetical protein